MRSSVSKKLAGIAAVCLVASGSYSCCKNYVPAEVPPCPKMNERMLMEMLVRSDSPTIDYVADELIPYCKGIEAMRDDG